MTPPSSPGSQDLPRDPDPKDPLGRDKSGAGRSSQPDVMGRLCPLDLMQSTRLARTDDRVHVHGSSTNFPFLGVRKFDCQVHHTN